MIVSKIKCYITPTVRCERVHHGGSRASCITVVFLPRHIWFSSFFFPFWQRRSKTFPLRRCSSPRPPPFKRAQRLKRPPSHFFPSPRALPIACSGKESTGGGRSEMQTGLVCRVHNNSIHLIFIENNTENTRKLYLTDAYIASPARCSSFKLSNTSQTGRGRR